MINTRFPVVRSVAVMLGAVLLVGPAFSKDIEPDFLMMSDPAFDVPIAETVLPQGAIQLWRDMLLRPEPDLVKAAAKSVAVAQAEGFAGLKACVPELREALGNSDLHPEAAYAVCRVLIVLDARESADALFSLSKRHGTALRKLIEPALAEWDYGPIREEWRSRIADADTPRRELLMACAGAGRVKDEPALPLLLEIVRSPSRPADVRLAAARAAGEIARTGLETEVAQITGKTSRGLVDDLCAVFLIRRHVSAAAQELFLQFARHGNPTVAAPALRALLEIDPALVLPLAAEALTNSDAKVRQCGLDAYTQSPTVGRIALIADVMDDPHPEVRSSARRALLRFSQNKEFEDAVRKGGMEVLSHEGWRGQEQAALLLAALEHDAAASRLVELLDSERAEVMVTAAWALRVLAVATTKDGLLDRARRMTDHVLSTRHDDRLPGSDHQLGHLFEALAVLDDARAIPVMRRHIRKDVLRPVSRSGAIWGLGRLLEDQPDDALASKLMGRLTDVTSTTPELEIVRRMCAVTIGRMNAVLQLKALEAALGEYIFASAPDHAMAWAIRRMNGQLPPVLPPPTLVRRKWPIEPAPPRENR